MVPVSQPHLVKRHGKIVGIHYGVSGDLFCQPLETSEDAMRFSKLYGQKLDEGIRLLTPELFSALRGNEFNHTSQLKRKEIEKYWAARGEPVRNEQMLAPKLLVAGPKGTHVFWQTDKKQNGNFNDVMASRALIEKYLDKSSDPQLKEKFFQLLINSSAFDGKSKATFLVPSLASKSFAANIIRLVHSNQYHGPVAMVIFSGDLSIAGTTANAQGKDPKKGVLGTIGGAVSLDRDPKVNGSFDVRSAANRELREETAVGFIGGKHLNAGLEVQADGQLASFQLHDLSDVNKSDFEKRLNREIAILKSGRTSTVLALQPGDPELTTKLNEVKSLLKQHGPSFEFFSAMRKFAPDAAETERYLAVPLEKHALAYLLLHPKLEQRTWATLMLVGLVERQFGKEAVEDLVAVMADPELSRIGFDYAARQVDNNIAVKSLVSQMQSTETPSLSLAS